MAEQQLPTGTVTFLFTDIEGSTRMLQALGERYDELLAAHARIVRQAIAAHDGTEVSTEGDSFFAVFRSAADAVGAAADVQRGLASMESPAGGPLRVRIGMHTGEGRLGGDNYAGIDVHRAARIAAAAHGEQVLLSQASHAMVRRALPAGTGLIGLGRHRLKDLDEPEELYQLAIEGLRNQFPPPRSVEGRPTNLPTPATSFIGRADEISEALRLLAASRLLTLTGPGGTGKTRLAVEVGRRALPDFDDGVFFVALDAISDPGLVPSAVAGVLRVEEGGRSAEEALGDYLASRTTLLVLDNFEQIVEAAGFVDRLMAVAPRLKVLVTSRIPLRLYGEQEYEVDPLGLPRHGAQLDAARLSQYEAVALFIERARAVRPDFAVTNDNAPAVAELCVRLDGLPLAIELAAARTKVLDPDAILARLGQRLDLLASQAPNVPARQRTLSGAIEWSYELLPDAERALFERLSVFAGGWDLEAAEAVCDPGGELGIDILEGTASLVDKSLVRATARMGESRFRMLQMIREYAWERLSSEAGAEAVLARHAAYYTALVEKAEPELEGAGIQHWLPRLTHDQGNLRALLARGIESGRAESAMRLMAAGWRFWQARGLLAEARAWCEQILALAPARARNHLRARMVTAAAGIAYWQGDTEAAERWYAEERSMYEELGDEHGIADAIQNLGFTAFGASGPDASREYLLDALERFRALGDTKNIASVSGAVGYTEFLLGRPLEALPKLEEALAGSRAVGWVGRMHDNEFAIGHVYRQLGRYADSARYYRRATLGVQEMGDLSRALMVVGAVAALLANVGRYDDALRLSGARERAIEEQGGALPTAMYGGLDAVEQARTDAGLDEAAVRARIDEGRAMDVDALIARALELLEEVEASAGVKPAVSDPGEAAGATR